MSKRLIPQPLDSAECECCCDPQPLPASLSRRSFLGATAGVATAGAFARPLRVEAARIDAAAGAEPQPPESAVKKLFDSLSETQRGEICFDWDHQDPRRGLLRTFVANNWNVTKPEIVGEFYSDDQRAMIREIYEGLIHPDWYERYDQHLKDDAGGWGRHQSIAIFGTPGEGKFELVMTGRHMTLRCDGDSEKHVAFGGPIFYGHAAEGFNESKNHAGNVFWPQALEANKLYQMLDGKQQKLALVDRSPRRESSVEFQGVEGRFPGIPVTELSSDQKAHLQKVLQVLIEPFRQDDRDETLKCLAAQGGLDKCSLAYFADRDIGGDGVWDNWRLEGPSFVWWFRGSPHVHVWVNVADHPSVKLNA